MASLHVREDGIIYECSIYDTLKEATPGVSGGSFWPVFDDNGDVKFLGLWPASNTSGGNHSPLKIRKNGITYWVETIVEKEPEEQEEVHSILWHYAELNWGDMWHDRQGLSDMEVWGVNQDEPLPEDGMHGTLWEIAPVGSAERAFAEANSLERLGHYETEVGSITDSWDMSGVTNMKEMFLDCYNLENGLGPSSHWNTSNVTDMSYMFKGCCGLVPNEVGYWNTSKVNDMSYMFSNCGTYTWGETLDLSNLNTSSVTNMEGMFYNIETDGLEIILGNWNTSKVTNMSHMFDYTIYGDNELNLYEPLANWDTSSVEDMSHMFCNSWVEHLPIENWNTSNVKDFSYMFYSTMLKSFSPIAHIDEPGWEEYIQDQYSDQPYFDVSKWNMSNAVDISYMFRNCSDIMDLDVSTWDTSNVVNMAGVFMGCSSLQTYYPEMLAYIDYSSGYWDDYQDEFEATHAFIKPFPVTNWNTSKVTDMSHLFQGCTYLMRLDLSHWDTSKVTDMSYMFQGCENLYWCDLSTFNFSNVTNMSYMFANCYPFFLDILENFDMSNVTNTAGMFEGVEGTKWYTNEVTTSWYLVDPLDIVTNWNMSNVTDISHMFSTNYYLTGLNLTNWDVSNVTSMAYLFYNDVDLATVGDLSNWDVSNVINMSYLFACCGALDTVGDLSNWNTSNLKNMSGMFSSDFHGYSWYGNGSKILTMDISWVENWDVSNVINMSFLFDTSGVSIPDMSNWNTGNLTNTQGMFRKFNIGELLNLSMWDMHSLTHAVDMFEETTGGIINLSGWNMPDIKKLYCIFEKCKCAVIDVSNWSTPNVTSVDSLFKNCGSNIVGLSTWVLPNITSSLTYTFYSCTNITELDLRGWDTSKLKKSTIYDTGTFNYTFAYCDKLTRIDVSNWITSTVTEMQQTFRGCTKLISLDLSSWDTSKVTKYTYMFYNCSTLKVLDLSNFDTTNMNTNSSASGYMFNSCPLEYIIIDSPTFKFKKLPTNHGLNNTCKILVPSNLLSQYTASSSGWYAKRNQFDAIENYIITRSNGQVSVSIKPQLFDISYYATNNVLGFPDATRLSSSNIHDLTNITLDTDATCAIGMEFDAGSDDHVYFETLDGVEATWNTSHVEIMESMFYNCQELTELDVSGWDVSNVTNMYMMFRRCFSLETLDVSNWNTQSLENANSLFDSCYSLTELNVSNWNVSNVTDMGWMFGWLRITSLDLSGWDTRNVMDMSFMFACDSSDGIQVLDLSNFNTTSVIPDPYSGMYQMFETSYGVTNPLEYLIIGSPVFKFIMWDSNCGDLPRTTKILVPRELLSTYRNATNWSTRADQFYAIEDYVITRLDGKVSVSPR